MANTKSAAKSARQTVRRTERNAGVITALKTGQKKLRVAVTGGKKEAVTAEFVALTSALDKAAKRGIIHRNAADRKKSRLAKAISKV